MKRVLIVGMNPHTIDFSKPGYLPGLTAEKVLTGLNAERENLEKEGFDSDMYLIDDGVLELSGLANQLKKNSFDGIMLGAGVRLPPSNFILFEKLVNTVHNNAPDSKTIFNTNPHDTADSVKRWF
jgi:hypothetical protein